MASTLRGTWTPRKPNVRISTLKVSAMTTLHQEHTAHEHVHGPECGHTEVPHGDHVDYLHDGHRHASHEGHWDDH
ncbi:hypothetical protein B5181_10300 [Streptomyces sp. 4F]|nr:hypothetical protein B5181_10300 [Streptomyces sp. 4F]